LKVCTAFLVKISRNFPEISGNFPEDISRNFRTQPYIYTRGGAENAEHENAGHAKAKQKTSSNV